MITTIYSELGAERLHTIALTYTDSVTGEQVLIPSNSIEDVELRIGEDICLKTIDGSLEFVNEKRGVTVKLGLIEGLEPWTLYELHLTVYDAEAIVLGLPWQRIALKTTQWERCTE